MVVYSDFLTLFRYLTASVQGNKKYVPVAHHGIEYPCLQCMALCGLLLSYVAFYGLDVAFRGHDNTVRMYPH